MKSVIVLCLLALSLTAQALPTPKSRWSIPYFWESSSSPRSTFIDFIGKRGARAGSSAPFCDLSQAVLPTASTKPLPEPDSRLTLSHVAIGRGTQNYTCDLSNSSAIPVAVGAVASLFNVSCIAASMPPLLEHIPGIALDLPVPSSDDPNSPANVDLSGHHYFTDTTTPFFSLDTSSHSYGSGAFKKVNSTNAPDEAMKGPQGKGDGAVPWLLLTAKDPEGQVLQEIFRVNTAGGSPPSSCDGMLETFEVPYSAAYWVYE